jgi:hypothetical protein
LQIAIPAAIYGYRSGHGWHAVTATALPAEMPPRMGWLPEATTVLPIIPAEPSARPRLLATANSPGGGQGPEHRQRKLAAALATGLRIRAVGVIGSRIHPRIGIGIVYVAARLTSQIRLAIDGF